MFVFQFLTMGFKRKVSHFFLVSCLIVSKRYSSNLPTLIFTLFLVLSLVVEVTDFIYAFVMIL